MIDEYVTNHSAMITDLKLPDVVTNADGFLDLLYENKNSLENLSPQLLTTILDTFDLLVMMVDEQITATNLHCERLREHAKKHNDILTEFECDEMQCLLRS